MVKKFLLLIVLGIASVGLGLYLAFLGIKSMENDSLPWQAVPSLPAVGVGVFLFIRAGKTGDFVISRKDKALTEAEIKNPTGNVLARNNEILNDWTKTNEKKDKMHMLRIAAAAAEEKATS